jgi:hypothetical protein
MPAHIRFIDLLKVPFATVAINAAALRNNVTNGPGIKSPVSPGKIYSVVKRSTRRREITPQNYTDYRQRMDSYDPGDADAEVTVPNEDWDLYFKPGTVFDAAVFTHYQRYANKPGYSFTLILSQKKDVLKRIEVMAPDISSPSMVWINGKGVAPNAGAPSGYEFSEEKPAF